ncbi:TetR/AcrR family transcriptional regulator [Ferrovibrio sp.]|uniref:TetR/AcrR family transcriptional regulator n=1 Tax=Ferrovibrio sp. TaxID=1917215 RepID=UPI001B4CF44C|nr:TetR/AcrR family transcriptional regulator [Ferrovibrio sp.]MBP7063324.1 TetR/AcrR family transcriptional regulator [Ferrovibrio sp.]
MSNTKRAAAKVQSPALAVAAEAEPGGESRALARRRIIITEAAKQFVKQGFDGTSMRDIAAASGIMAGSLYYHFASKEELFVAVHGTGMDLIEKAVRRAMAGLDDPWLRLEAAAAAHCETMLGGSDLGAIVTQHFSPSMAKIKPELIAQRDKYEILIKQLVADLDLPPSIPPAVFRLHYLGALNWLPTWYRPGQGLPVAQLGKLLVAMLRGAGAFPDLTLGAEPVLPARKPKRK